MADRRQQHGVVFGNRVSTYREQVTRELSLLAAQGLEVRDGHSLVVKDLATLERMVVEVEQVG